MVSSAVYEIIGYVASLLVAISLMMSAIIRLRIINMIGAATFTLYGLLIGAMPVAAMNGFIVLVNIWYLSRILFSKEYFRMLRVSPDDQYLKHFLDFYRREIRTYQPDFEDRTGSTFQPDGNDLCMVILRDMVPAGLVIGRTDSSGVMHIILDFVIPNYRDFKTGNYIYRERREFLRSLGIRKLIARADHPSHRKYLLKMGFKPAESDQNRFELNIR